MSERAVIHSADKNQYFYHLKNELEKKSMDYAIPFGISRDCLKNVFDYREIRSDVVKVFDGKLNDQKEIVDVGNIEKRILRNVEKKEGKLNSKQKASLNVYIKKITDMYYKKIHFPTESTMVKMISKSTSVVWISIPLSSFIAIVCAFYMIVSRHYAYHGMRYVAYGIMGAGVFLAVSAAAIISNGFIYNYNITDAFMKMYYVYWIGHPLLMTVISGIAVMFLGLIFIFLIYRQKYRIRA